jgi:magnesium transporter
MITRSIYKKLTWVDLEKPTKDEVRGLMEEYSISPLVADELLSPTLRPKVEMHENLIYFVLHFPTISRAHGRSSIQEIDFIIGQDFLITTHYELIDPLHQFSKAFEVNSILEKNEIGDHAGYLFFYIIRDLYRTLTFDLYHLEKQLAEIEKRIFNGDEDRMVEKISQVNRDLLDIRQAIRPHKEVFDSFEIVSKKFFGEEFSYNSKIIVGEYYKISNILGGLKETLLDLRETNDSLLTTKTNKIMTRFTVMAFATFPLTLIAGIFSMKSDATPIVGLPYDFYIILGIMGMIALTMFISFKSKKWM